MPKAIKKKIAKPSDQPVEVENALHKIVQEAADNRQLLVRIAAALAAVLVIAIGAYLYSSGRAAKADELEYRAYKTYQGLYEQVQPASSVKAEQALDLFKQAYEARKSPFSLYYIALCQYDLAQYDEAANTLARFLAEHPDDVRFISLVYFKLAMSNMKAGKADEALRYFTDMNTLASNAMKDMALIEAARLLDRMGRSDEAVSRYQAIVTQFPTSYFAAEAKQKLGIEDEQQSSVGAPAGQGPLMIQPADKGETPVAIDLGPKK